MQDYNVDDDGRLASVKKHHGKVVSPVFIDRCESEGRVLGFHEYLLFYSILQILFCFIFQF